MSRLAGTTALVRLAVRRDRRRLPIWIAGLATLLAMQAAGNAETYPSEADRTAAATILAANPALRLLRGPAADASLGALIMSDAFWILAVLTALMSSSSVIRHTRQDEETGRSELIGAAPVGPYANLTAALTVTVAANLALAGLLALALVANGLPAVGCLAAAGSIAATGITFAGIAAVAAQVSPHARTANALSAAAIGAAYLLRGIGDVLGRVEPGGITVATAWPTWLSPIGWAQQIRAFEADNWWMLALPTALFAAATGLAFLLATHRDFGLGMLPSRGGPPAARPSLLSPLGLARRLQRATLLGWATGMLIAGALFGSLGQQVVDLSENAQFVEILGRLGDTDADFTDTYFAATMALVGAISAGYPLQALLRMRAEETGGRLEPLMATAVGRTRWMAGHVICATLGTLLLLLLAGASAGLTHALVSGETTRVSTLTIAGLIHAPAALALSGFVIAAFGLLPRWAETLSWAALTLSLLLGPLGEILNLPQAARDISPFSHTPAAPAAAVTATPILALLAAAAILATAGLVTFHRRDLALPA
jgi:ABC-2 type transport system permease protein